jgi:uncharacterized membrane protein YdjX (TVP38/TMEM64 family)
MELRRLDSALRWGALGLLGALAAAGLWPYRSLLLDPQALALALDRLGPWQVAVFLLAHGVAAAFGLPGAVVAIAGGALFGTLWGTVWSVLGATLGAAIAFQLARTLGQAWCQRRLQHHRPLAWLNQRLQAQAFWCVLTLRLTPISPFSLMNLLLGLTSVRFWPYLGGTAIGIVPGTLAYSWLGAAGVKALRGDSLLPLVAALGLLAVLSALPVVLGRVRSDRP